MTPPLQGQAAVDQLLEILDLKQVDAATFTGDSPQTGAQRVFGGQVAGQALVAAGRTVDPGRLVHSLHGYFVRPGDPTEPITFHVENIRDGRSFSVRRSTAKQHGKTIFFMSASFQVPEEGLDHHEPAPSGVPAPEDVPTMRDWVERYPDRRSVFNASPQAVDVRYIGQPGWVPPGDRDAEPKQRVWMRVDGKLPDDPLIHACALTYASDLSLLDAVLSYHGEVWGPGGVVGASLDHALWFHRTFRADEWFLYDSASPSASRARGLANGRMFTRDGRHIASAVQEGLLRRVGA
ncbi:acyl-CoA thioesterase [Actinoplanes teichomyceticus]|uniref:Acyl-CoA thioesterase 2 n=1 Tax=Actinoplanes teichomyceticus TaxID=1867 RepID=A0A561WJ93_ACTTI|nr:acyl-CoA thioesterase II [Actinoplanes teichomyceticus]TWG23935.1 acyl-CoA thioesterase-2 [Actinoplanes teichomyceticus]GIF11978.1 acyl-CoA thioesterase II [Actinoplanes teichomyceticus]